MQVFGTKNDYKEFVCKFKGHRVADRDLESLQARPEETHSATCERCNFGITIRMDPDDDDYCLVSDRD